MWSGPVRFGRVWCGLVGFYVPVFMFRYGAVWWGVVRFGKVGSGKVW